MVHDHASGGGDDVAVPVDVVAVGELRDETFGRAGQDHARLIGATGFASDVALWSGRIVA
jgi:hypothetical protein